MERPRGGQASPAATAIAGAATDRDLTELLAAIDEMSRVIGLASAHQNVRGQLRKAQVEDIFMACKTVMVMAEPMQARP